MSTLRSRSAPAVQQWYTYSRADLGVSVVGLSSGRLYGINTSTGHWVYSDDVGVNWTDTLQSPSVNPGTSAIIQLIFHSTYVIAVTSDGRLFRNTKDTYTGWTTITVAAAPVGTTGRIDICVSNGTYLYYGNYNASSPGEAHIWRSSDNGDTWSEVFSEPTGRHIHALYVDPNASTRIFATVGDATSAGKGLYVSHDSGGTWARLSSNRYGIDLVIPSTNNRVVLEGDGLNQPHIFTYDYANAVAGVTGNTDSLIAYDYVAADWQGTARSIAITSDGNLFYVTTAESGATGTREGIWVAKGPGLTVPFLLEEITGSSWPYGKTYETGGFLFNYKYKMSKPKFTGQ